MTVRYLVVNADDFGASRGINRGIIEAHRRGIVTSASLMVATPWSEDAVALARGAPDLDIGLHADLGGAAGANGTALPDTGRAWAELRRQLRRFEELMGRLPTHLDSHHNVHRDTRLLPAFLDVARRHRLFLREHSPVRYCSAFYGQWGGDTHLEQIGIDGLARLLDEAVGEGITELACHPGWVDAELRSGYAREREAELGTLCDPATPRLLTERDIRLITFRDLCAPSWRAQPSGP